MNETIAERYARAIFEVGEEAGKLPEVARHFQQLAEAFEQNHELRVALTDPVLPEASRENVLKALGSRLSVCTEALNAARVMLRRRRLSELSTTARRLGELADEKTGMLRATVTSAAALSPTYADELCRELEKATGRKVVLEQSVDASLIAGVVIRIGSHVVDGSMRGRLLEFERRLQRAS
jgi:F-type H+-transporting ATPase subunit delta